MTMTSIDLAALEPIHHVEPRVPGRRHFDPRHLDAPVVLSLTGPAGGQFVHRGTEELAAVPARVELDAVEFCRIVSGRGDGSGALGQQVPF